MTTWTELDAMYDEKRIIADIDIPNCPYCGGYQFLKVAYISGEFSVPIWESVDAADIKDHARVLYRLQCERCKKNLADLESDGVYIVSVDQETLRQEGK